MRFWPRLFFCFFVVTGLVITASTTSVFAQSNAQSAQQQLRIKKIAQAELTKALAKFEANQAKITLPMPEAVSIARKELARIGIDNAGLGLEEKSLKALLQLQPQAARLFAAAIEEHQFNDAKTLLGPKTGLIAEVLRQEIAPKVQERLKPAAMRAADKTGARPTADELMEKYQAIPFAPEQIFKVEDYLAQQAVQNIVSMMSQVR